MGTSPCDVFRPITRYRALLSPLPDDPPRMSVQQEASPLSSKLGRRSRRRDTRASASLILPVADAAAQADTKYSENGDKIE